MSMTFFEWVEREGQTAVARALGEGFHLVRVHRAAHAKHGVDEGLIARCEAVLGEQFDRSGTLDRWYQMRQLRLGTPPAPAAADAEPADSNSTAVDHTTSSAAA